MLGEEANSQHISSRYYKTSLFLAASSHAENLLHFNLPDFPVAYQIMEVTLMVMGNSKNSRVLKFVILLKLRKFDACEIYVSYSNQ